MTKRRTFPLSRSGVSCYQRGQGKTPYKYSPAHQAWRTAVLANNPKAVERAADQHSAQFGPK